MKISAQHAAVCAVAIFTMLALNACIGVGVGVGPVGVGYDAGYYEPYGYDYGGWGRGYGVGPWHGGFHPAGPGGPHAYRSAPPGRSMPSLPSRPRGR